MPDAADTTTPDQLPAFVPQLRRVLEGAVARHHGQVLLRHHEESGPGRHGWRSVLQLVDPRGVYVTVWYDGFDQDVMAWGDLPYREWWPQHDPAAASSCLQDLEQLVDDLVAHRRGQAVAAAQQRHRRAQRSSQRWWRALARRRGLLEPAPAPCPWCASALTSPVVASGPATWGGAVPRTGRPRRARLRVHGLRGTVGPLGR